MSSVGDNVITSRGRPKPTPIEHGALFQPLPPETLPMVERQTSISPLERISTPTPGRGRSFGKPGHSGEGRDAHHRRERCASPQSKEDSTSQQAAPSNEDPPKGHIDA